MTAFERLDALDRNAFVAALGHVYELSPWVAEGALRARPFADVDELAAAMTAVVDDAPRSQQLALVRAHPDLAGRAAIAGELTEQSASEQSGAGLDRLTAAEHARLTTLNDAYRARFEFPFVICVRNHDTASILAAFERRLRNPADVELATALAEIHAIARLRLEDALA